MEGICTHFEECLLVLFVSLCLYLFRQFDDGFEMRVGLFFLDEVVSWSISGDRSTCLGGFVVSIVISHGYV